MQMKIYILALSLLFFTACEQAKPAESIAASALVPSDAKDLRYDHIGSQKQTSFVVDRAYPQFAFQDLQIKQLVSEGWQICKSNKDDWETFIDASSGETRRVHQKKLHMYKKGELILIFGRFISTSERALSHASKFAPDTPIQFGTVLFMRGSEKDIQSALSSFGAKCES
jgi:hypothetical protein